LFVIAQVQVILSTSVCDLGAAQTGKLRTLQVFMGQTARASS
jgi:hypothetical protein